MRKSRFGDEVGFRLRSFYCRLGFVYRSGWVFFRGLGGGVVSSFSGVFVLGFLVVLISERKYGGLE